MSDKEIKQATEKVIKEMLTESTGKHFMDSGDAYGRHWEENQRDGIKTGYQLCDFYINKEKQTCELIPTIPIFDVFSSVLRYTDECKYLEQFIPSYLDSQETLFWIEEEVQQGYVYNRLSKLIIDRKIDYYQLWGAEIQLLGSSLNYAYNLLSQYHKTVFHENEYIGTYVSNSYNSECILTQNFMSVYFEYENEPYIAISVHNGCDIRGGYTDVHIFDVGCEDDFLTAQSDVSIDCLHTDEEQHICESGYQIYCGLENEYYSHLEQKDVDEHYIYQHTYVDENNRLRCKECGGLVVCSSIQY